MKHSKSSQSESNTVGLGTRLLRLVLLGLFLCPSSLGDSGVFAQTNSEREEIVASQFEFDDAIKRNNLNQAQEVALKAVDFFARSSEQSTIAADWFNRAGFVFLLQEKFEQSRPYYAQVCSNQFDSNENHQLDCLAGLALANISINRARSVQLAQRTLDRGDSSAKQGVAISIAHLTIAADGLSRGDPQTAEEHLNKSVGALIAHSAPPRLVEMIAMGLTTCGDAFIGTAKDWEAAHRVQQKAVDTLTAVVGSKSALLLPALVALASTQVLIGRHVEARNTALWSVNIAISDEDTERAAATVALARSTLVSAGYRDDAIQLLWRWQANIEERSGTNSTQAAQSLVEISDYLYMHGERTLADAVRDRGLRQLEALHGRDSTQYKDAEATPGRQAATNMAEVVDNYKKHTQEQIGSIQRLNTRETEHTARGHGLNGEDLALKVDEAIEKSVQAQGTQGIPILLEAWSELQKLMPRGGVRASQFEKELRDDLDKQSARLMDKGYATLIASRQFHHWTFTAVVWRKARHLRQTLQPIEALRLLDESLNAVVDRERARVTISQAKILGMYPAVYTTSLSDPIRESVLRSLKARFGELQGIAELEGADSELASVILESLVEYGEKWQEISEKADSSSAAKSKDLATAAYLKARRLAEKMSSVNDIVKEKIENALGTSLDTLTESEATLKSARESIALLPDDDPTKVDRYMDLVSLYTDTNRDDGKALEFIRLAAQTFRAKLRSRVSTLPISGSDEVRWHKKYFDSATYLRLLSGGGRSDDIATVKEALDIIQWRPNLAAGDSWLRTANRLTLPSEIAGEARVADAAAVRWKSILRQLLDARSKGDGNAPIGTLTQALEESLKELTGSTTSLRAASPLYQSLTGVDTVSLANIQSAMNPDEAVIAYAFDDIKGLWAAVVTKEKATFTPLLEYLDPRIEQFIPQSAELDGALRTMIGNYPVQTAKALYDVLVHPIEMDLAEVRRLIIIPDPVMATLPFPALVRDIKPSSETPNLVEWLAERYSVSIAPSLKGFVALRSINNTPEFKRPYVGFADPIIPNADKRCQPISAWGKPALNADKQSSEVLICSVPETMGHVTALAEAFQTKAADSIYAGVRFTRSNVLDSLTVPSRVVVLATHGVLANEAYKAAGLREPSLLLSSTAEQKASDRWLTRSEIELLNIQAELVILSACNSGGSDGSSAEALSGLAQAFFEAGAQGMMVTNWYIDASRTQEVLEQLASGLAKAKPADHVADVLQAAMIFQLQRHSHPRDWAMFTYIGK